MTWEKVKTWTMKIEGGHLRHRVELEKSLRGGQMQDIIGNHEKAGFVQRKEGHEWEAVGGR